MLSLALLSGSGQTEPWVGTLGEKTLADEPVPSSCLSSLTATIIIIWRDGPEVVGDVVGVNEMKKSSVCAVSPG